MLMKIAYRITGSRADAEDVVQFSFVELHRSTGKVKTSVRSWLKTVARRRARNIARNRRIEQEELEKYLKLLAPQLASRKGVLRSNRVLEEDEVADLLARLPHDLQFVIVRHYIDLLPVTQIAREQHLAPATVRARLSQAHRVLRRMVATSAAAVTAACWPLGNLGSRKSYAAASRNPPTRRATVALWLRIVVPITLTATVIGVGLLVAEPRLLSSVPWISDMLYLRSHGYDVMQDALRDQLERGGHGGFDQRIAAAAVSPTQFWLGGQDLFFDWAARAEWDASAPKVVSPGSLSFHPGEVPFGDSASVPADMDLVAALVALRLHVAPDGGTASADGGSLSAELYQRFRSAYASALRDPMTHTRPTPKQFMADVHKAAAELTDAAGRLQSSDKYHFRPLPFNGNEQRDVALAEVAAALNVPRVSSPDWRVFSKLRSLDDIKDAILDVAEVTTSATESAGNYKLAVVLREPSGEPQANVVLLLEQQIPAAAERQLKLPSRNWNPAWRAEQDRVALGMDTPIESWTTLWKMRFRVSPLTHRLATPSIPPSEAAEWAGRFVASYHRCSASADQLSPLLLDETWKRLQFNVDNYLDYHLKEYHFFKRDPRVLDTLSRFGLLSVPNPFEK